jgi:hypothetical protein
MATANRILSGTIPVLASIKNVFAGRSQEQTLADYAAIINALRGRVVVMIDEIDRMGSNELQELFRILRANPSAGRLTFICALNKHAVARQLSESQTDYSNQYAFIEKFFPVQVELSRIEPGILQERFVTRIRELEKSFDLANTKSEKQELLSYLDSLWAALASRILTNFRKMDLYLESLETLVASAPRELNYLDAILIELVKALAPAKYDEIYRRRYLFYKPGWAQNDSLEIPFQFDDKEKAKFAKIYRLTEK